MFMIFFRVLSFDFPLNYPSHMPLKHLLPLGADQLWPHRCAWGNHSFAKGSATPEGGWVCVPTSSSCLQTLQIEQVRICQQRRLIFLLMHPLLPHQIRTQSAGPLFLQVRAGRQSARGSQTCPGTGRAKLHTIVTLLPSSGRRTKQAAKSKLPVQ